MHEKNPDTGRAFTRRGFIGITLGTLGATAGIQMLPRLASADHHESGEAPELVTDVEANQLLLAQVKYVPVSELEGKQCANCALLVVRDGEYGRCGLFQQGKVPVTAWCTSWIQKPGT